MLIRPMLKEYMSFELEGGATPPGAVVGDGNPALSGGGGGQPNPGAVAPTPAPPAPGQPPAGGAEPEPEHEVVIDGQKVRVRLSELTAGYSRQQDYTRKTTELATQRKEFEGSQQRLVQEGVQAEINRILDGGQPARGGTEPAPEEQEPDRLALLSENQRNMQEQMADDKLDRTMAELKAKHPNLDERLLLLEASEAGVKEFSEMSALAEKHVAAQQTSQATKLEAVLSDDNSELGKKMRDMVIAAYLKTKSDPANHLTPGGGAKPAPTTPPANGTPQSRYAIDDAAVARLRALHSGT